MSRKNTLLIAAMVNFGLLAVLFFTATATREEKLPLDPSAFLVENQIPVLETNFAPPELVVPPAEQLALKQEKEIVHKLPEMEIKPKQEEPLKEKKTPLKEVIIKKGDSLDKIAKLYHVSIDQIIKTNELKTTVIRIGQMLKIPSPQKNQSAPHQESKAKQEYYVVKPGDNPWTIAMKHHMKTEDLLRLNGLNKKTAKKLRPGDRLKIR